MPRLTIDELAGYKFDVMQGEAQVVDGGTPVFNGSGEPKMETTYMFVFTGLTPHGDTHIVRIPIPKEGKEALVQALTGGVQVASPVNLPPGVTL